MKVVIALLIFLACLVLSSTVAQSSTADPTFCDPKCAVRCSKASSDLCLKYCGICCEKCHCVPSGTYGHMDECPCYRDMKNRKGGHKCP
uniref:Uncharacterized protein n=1 Tax=Kalanchoe fedtschenkoi TaxID=63787 RepID=A0A7N0TQS1_KALFE